MHYWICFALTWCFLLELLLFCYVPTNMKLMLPCVLISFLANCELDLLSYVVLLLCGRLVLCYNWNYICLPCCNTASRHRESKITSHKDQLHRSFAVKLQAKDIDYSYWWYSWNIYLSVLLWYGRLLTIDYWLFFMSKYPTLVEYFVEHSTG